MALLLSDDELVQLTEYKRPADQRRWLHDRGYHYAIGARGTPRVARAEAERQLVGGQGVATQPTEPDWQGFK